MVPILFPLFEIKVKKKKRSLIFSLIHSETFIEHLLCAGFWVDSENTQMKWA